MDEQLKEFWLVWNPKGRSSTKKHFNEHDSIEEAKRIAKKESLSSGNTSDIYILRPALLVRSEISVIFKLMCIESSKMCFEESKRVEDKQKKVDDYVPENKFPDRCKWKFMGTDYAYNWCETDCKVRTKINPQEILYCPYCSKAVSCVP